MQLWHSPLTNFMCKFIYFSHISPTCNHVRDPNLSNSNGGWCSPTFAAFLYFYLMSESACACESERVKERGSCSLNTHGMSDNETLKFRLLYYWVMTNSMYQIWAQVSVKLAECFLNLLSEFLRTKLTFNSNLQRET